MAYSTSLDRTAVWVGDRFHYTITINYSPQFEFVLDNLNKENINLDPFPVIDVTRQVTPQRNNEKRLSLDITLANFTLGQNNAQIPQITLYYFRRDRPTSSAEQAAAEGLTIPGPVVGIRSTLAPNPTDIRDAAGAVNWRGARWIVPAAGWAALVLLLAGLAWEIFRYIKNRGVVAAPDRSVLMEAVRTRWAGAVPADFSDHQKTRAFFDRSGQSVKEYLGYYLETGTAGLTADEMRDEMQRLGASDEVTQKVARVLSTCESACYSPNGLGTSEESARTVAQDVRQILSLAPRD